MQLIDTHCHIHEANYPLPIDEVEERAKGAEVAGLLCVGTTIESSREAVEFVASRDGHWATIGLHPHDAKLGGEAFDQLAELADKPKVVGIGECGLDYFYNHSPKEDQHKALRFQLELAQKHNLPVVFHVREAFDDFWPIFDEFKGLAGVLHSFTDTQANVDKALERGLLIGINGIMTFTKNDWQLELIKNLPLQKILLETDAPYLTPVPHRGTINEPARVRQVAEFLASLRSESLDDIAAATTKTARELFHL